MSHAAAAKAKRLRGAMLQLLRTNHDGQATRFDGTALWSALVRGLGFDAGRNEVKTMLQDLCQRGYVTCKEHKDRDTGEVRFTQIALTPRGRDLLEETIEDPAVEL
jgi:hypothetical protein